MEFESLCRLLGFLSDEAQQQGAIIDAYGGRKLKPVRAVLSCDNRGKGIRFGIVDRNLHEHEFRCELLHSIILQVPV